MNCSKLAQFRQDVFATFQRRSSALFDLYDALLTNDTAQTFADLAVSPGLQRGWSSMYKALQSGAIDLDALRRVFAGQIARPARGHRLLLAADTSALPKPEAKTSPDRTYVYTAKGRGKHAEVRAGYAYSTLVAVPTPPSSWCQPLDDERVASTETATTTLVRQLERTLPRLPVRPVVDLDRGYGHERLVAQTAGLACDFFVRIASNRVFYHAPAPRQPGQRGRPVVHGAKFSCACAKSTDHGTPDEVWTGPNAAGEEVTVQAWHNLHMYKHPNRSISVYRVYRSAATGTERDPLVSWYMWLGEAPAPLDQVAMEFAPGRYSIEHLYRFRKQALLWAAARLRTPEQVDRWTALLNIVQTTLVVGRELVTPHRRPYESRTRPLTPGLVRRSLGPIIGQVGTLAAPPQPRGKSSGRRPGSVIGPAKRFAVVRKPAQRTKKGQRNAAQARRRNTPKGQLQFRLRL